jgi:O-antigen/teichoic acid export membrane protein
MAYSRAILRSVVPAVLRDIVWRLFIIVALLAYYYQLISFHYFIWLYALGYALPMLVMVVYLFYHKEVQVSSKLQMNGKMGELMKYGRYVFIGTLTTVTINEVDKIMISWLSGESSTGVYQVAAFFSQVILIPGRSIVMVAAPLVAGFLANNEMEKVERIYKKSSINQLIAGLFIFAGIYINLHNIFRILPAEYKAGEYVIIFLGISKLFDLATGINGEIIINSKYFRWDLFFNLGLLALILICDYLLIPRYGITGAAMASAAVILVYNATKSWFLWIVYRIQPFSVGTVIVIGITLVVVALNYFLPVLPNLITDLLYRSVIMTILYGLLVLLLKVSPDVNDTVSKMLARAGMKKR